MRRSRNRHVRRDALARRADRQQLGRGALDQVYIRGKDGFVILMSIGEEAVLTTLVREGAKLGLVFLDMKRAADDLEKLV